MKKTITLGKNLYRAFDKDGKFKGFCSATSKDELDKKTMELKKKGFVPEGKDITEPISFSLEVFIKIDEIDE